MSDRLTKEELQDVISGIQENNEPEAYINTPWYAELLRQLKASKPELKDIGDK